MSRVEDIIEHVEFRDGFDAGNLEFNERYGFVEEAGVVRDGLVRLLGFARPIARGGGVDNSDIVMPIVDLHELPPENRTIDEQGKGVGPRLYNIRESFGGARNVPDEVGVYTIDLEEARIRDGRAAQGGKAVRIARHAGRMLRSKVEGLEAVVNRIHESYGDVDAVELEVPPHPELRRSLHGVANPEGIEPNFMIIRNPAVVLRKVGTTSLR